MPYEREGELELDILKKHGQREELVILKHVGGFIRRPDGRGGVYAGFGEGASDLYVPTAVVITPEMVGQTVCILAVVELKRTLEKVQTDKRRLSLQKAHQAALRRVGARVGFADSVEMFEEVVFGRK